MALVNGAPKDTANENLQRRTRGTEGVPRRPRKLGIHRSVAVQWQNASGGDWAAYAADVASRPVRTRPAN
jgi:hypothetical protein